jgi:hypothetical protein
VVCALPQWILDSRLVEINGLNRICMKSIIDANTCKATIILVFNFGHQLIICSYLSSTGNQVQGPPPEIKNVAYLFLSFSNFRAAINFACSIDFHFDESIPRNKQ